jgi:hypothetical protein
VKGITSPRSGPPTRPLRAGQSEDWPLQCEFGDGEGVAALHVGGVLDEGDVEGGSRRIGRSRAGLGIRRWRGVRAWLVIL